MKNFLKGFGFTLGIFTLVAGVIWGLAWIQQYHGPEWAWAALGLFLCVGAGLVTWVENR